MSAEIIHGDCLDVMRGMAAGSVDIVVTSPPYNTLPTRNKPSGLHAERKKGVNRWIAKAANGYPDKKPEDEYQEWLREVIAECLRVSRGLVWVNHKIRYRNKAAIHPARFLPFPIYAEVVWDRGISMALNCKRYAPSHEHLFAFGVPHWWNDTLNTRMSVWRIPPERSDEHPCPFPHEIARRPIISSCPPGGVVLDPFAGRGTTGEAAIAEGRRFIGIELEEKFVKLARARIAHAEREAAQLPLLARGAD